MFKYKFKYKKFFLLTILLISLFLRIYKINSLSLYGDELTMVYDSYSILKTGRDQLGNIFPLTFKMGAGRPAGYVYFSIPFVALFGPGVWGVRSLSILSGVGIVFLMFLLGKKLFQESIGLVASFLTAISLWDISLSRGGFETHFALFLALLGIIFFLYAKEKPWLYVLFALSWGGAIHTYPTYKLVLFVFLPILTWYFGGLKILFKEKRIKFVVISILVGALAIGFSIRETFRGVSEKRFLNLNIFSQGQLREELVQKINFERNIDSLPQRIRPLFHNRPIEYTLVIADNYLQNFSSQFLFISGDKNPRHNMFEFGEFYYADFLLILIGILNIRKMTGKKGIKKEIFIFSWIFLAPLGAVLLLETHALRNSFMLPPLILLSSIGLVSLISKPRGIFKNFLLILIGIVFVSQFIIAFECLYFLSPSRNASFWSYPAKKAVDIVNKNKDKYDYIFLSNKIDNSECALEVYNSIDPKLVIAQNQDPEIINNLQFKHFGNVYVGSLPVEKRSVFLKKLENKKILFIGSYSEKNIDFSYDVVDSLDKTHALITERYNF